MSERPRTAVSVGALHPGLQCWRAAASAFRQPSPTCRTAFPAQRLRPSGIPCCWPDGLELSPGFFSGIQRAAQTVLDVYLKRTCSRDTSASSALGVLNDYALYKSMHSLPHSLFVRKKENGMRASDSYVEERDHLVAVLQVGESLVDVVARLVERTRCRPAQCTRSKPPYHGYLHHTQTACCQLITSATLSGVIIIIIIRRRRRRRRMINRFV